MYLEKKFEASLFKKFKQKRMVVKPTIIEANSEFVSKVTSISRVYEQSCLYILHTYSAFWCNTFNAIKYLN